MDLLKLLKLLGLPVFAYLLGSIPWGLILTRIFISEDIRNKGSGNIGATNVRRIGGSTLGLLTLVGDVLKGVLPVYLASEMTGGNDLWSEIYLSLVALSVFSGHLYPFFLNFKSGGKGVATAAGCFLVLSPMSCFVAIFVFILFVCWCNRVSAGSLAAAAILPVAVWEATSSKVLTGCAVVTTVFIYFRHKANIRRLLSGTEPVIWEKKG